RLIAYEISRMRGVCALNGMIRKTGVNTIAKTITVRAKSASQMSVRFERTLGMFFSCSTLCFPDHSDGPQHADCQKRGEIDQQIPATVTGWRSFHCRDCFSVALRALQSHADAPEFFGVEVYERAILDLARHVLPCRGVKGFRQATAGRLYADLYLQVWRRLAVDDHEE